MFVMRVTSGFPLPHPLPCEGRGAWAPVGVGQAPPSDTGAALSIINKQTWTKMGKPKLKSSTSSCRSYTGHPLDFNGHTHTLGALASDGHVLLGGVAVTLVSLGGNGGELDFGGGTLDLSVIRYSGAKFDVLSTAGADLGGDRIDQLISRRLLFPLLGEGEVWSRQIDGRTVETIFPFEEYEEGILNWAITHTLNQNRYKTRLTELIASGGAASLTGSPLARTSAMPERARRVRTLGAISNSTSLSSTDFVTLPIRPPVVTTTSPRRAACTISRCSFARRCWGRHSTK